eukprot:1120400-Prymnesium_polylepis.1
MPLSKRHTKTCGWSTGLRQPGCASFSSHVRLGLDDELESLRAVAVGALRDQRRIDSVDVVRAHRSDVGGGTTRTW